jgi:hypothetical protein
VKTLGPTGDWRPEELEEAGSEVLRVVAKYVGELEHTPVLPTSARPSCGRCWTTRCRRSRSGFRTSWPTRSGASFRT